MRTNEAIQELRAAAANAMAADTALFEVWRELPVEDVAQCCTETDVKMLCELIKYRIYPANAFELLARIDVGAALEALLDRYLGEAVDADRKFGGYSFELVTMLDDLVEIAGSEVLRELIRRDGFGKKHLNDHRVIEAFTEALDLDETQWDTWLKSNLAETVSAKAS